MSHKGHYEFEAWCRMETALDEYQQARQAYLDAEAKELGPEAEQQLSRMNRAADALVKGTQELVGVDGIEQLRELAGMPEFSSGKPFELVQEHVCIEFGWQVMKMLATARERFLDLLFLLQDREPSPSAKAFLQRVARCYLFGFDAECVVMCRAVLDREFGETVVDDDQVSEWWESYKNTPKGKNYRGKRPPYGNLRAKIQAAVFAEMIEEADGKAADVVRKRGNDGVHKNPDKDDALDAVEKTLQVLDALAEGNN